MTAIISATPTIMDGLVVRWHAVVNGDALLSASRSCVMIHGDVDLATIEPWLDDARRAHEALKAGRRDEAAALATHRRDRFMGRELVPISARRQEATMPEQDTASEPDGPDLITTLREPLRIEEQCRRHVNQADAKAARYKAERDDALDDVLFERKQVIALREVLNQVFTCIATRDWALFDDDQMAEWRERSGLGEDGQP